ncbi:MAG TPA: trypsin-like peptidase domain-containing protein [Mycobacterium sp.]
MPAQAAPLPAPSLDASAMVAQVGPSVVNVDTHMGYQGAVGAGTGIVLDPGGAVLTNNHVVSGATEIKVESIASGQTYDADVVGYDRTHDVAVLQLRGAAGLTPANIGNSAGVAVGEPVVAMGNAGGQGGTPSAVPGQVVGLNEQVSASDELTGSTEVLSNMIKASTPIRPGDSGGPLVNGAGQVIGMSTAASGNFKLPDTGGEGFAIPINQAMAIAGQIRAGNASNTVHIGPTGFLGVGVTEGDGGARVESAIEGMPAAQLGLVKEDVITAINGAPVDSPTALTNLLDLQHPGDSVAVTWRDSSGGVHTQSATLAPGPVG